MDCCHQISLVTPAYFCIVSLVFIYCLVRLSDGTREMYKCIVLHQFVLIHAKIPWYIKCEDSVGRICENMSSEVCYQQL
jgi:hypothetical protein